MTRRSLERPLQIAGGVFAPIGVTALICLLLLPDVSQAKDYSLHGRDIGCAEVAAVRSRQICEAISASLTWQWMGHATVAPGYKPSFNGIRNVYCMLKIAKDDVKNLQKLKNTTRHGDGYLTGVWNPVPTCSCGLSPI